MKSTQDHLPISDIKEDLVFLKAGGTALILQTTAVNFDLLSEMEQVAIIGSYGQMLNSLSFPIQILVRSKRLDITNYLHLLDTARSHQINPLLSELMFKYRQFVQSLIKQNEVLDKSFYIVLPLSGIELGILHKNKEEAIKKAKAILLPRKEQVSKQLSRIGLKGTQMGSKALIELFYDIYNPPEDAPKASINATPLPQNISKEAPEITKIQIPTPIPQPTIQTNNTISNVVTRSGKTHPFVVEELVDTI